MAKGIWIAAALLLSFTVMAGLVLLRHRAAGVRPARESTARRGQQAIRELGRHRRKTARGSLRGKGGGGDRNTAHDAAYGSDTSMGA